MAVPQNKQELQDAIRISYQKLVTDLVSIPSERAYEATLDGHVQGTQMSVSDLVAYLIGWNLLVLKWCDGKAKGLPVDFPETGYKWNELGSLAQKFYADHAGVPYADLLRQFAEVHGRILALVEGETNAALYGMPWYKKYTQGRMIQFNTSSPYINARGRLRKWKELNGIV